MFPFMLIAAQSQGFWCCIRNLFGFRVFWLLCNRIFTFIRFNFLIKVRNVLTYVNVHSDLWHVYLCLPLPEDEGSQACNHFGLFLKSFVILFCREEGRSCGLQRAFLIHLTTCQSLFITWNVYSILWCLLPISHPLCSHWSNQFLLLLYCWYEHFQGLNLFP